MCLPQVKHFTFPVKNFASETYVSQLSRLFQAFKRNTGEKRSAFSRRVSPLFFRSARLEQTSHHENTMKTMLTSFQCRSLKIFPSNGERTMVAIADGQVEVEELQAGHRTGKRGKEGKELEGRGDRVNRYLV